MNGDSSTALAIPTGANLPAGLNSILGGVTQIIGASEGGVAIPYALIHTPLGDVVIDLSNMLSGGGSGSGTVTVMGIPMTYSLNVGVPPTTNLLSSNLILYGAITLVILGVLWSSR